MRKSGWTTLRLTWEERLRVGRLMVVGRVVLLNSNNPEDEYLRF